MTKKLFRRFGTAAAALAFGGAMLCAVPAIAQDTAPPTPPGGGMGPRGARMEGHQIEMLTKKLNLTPDQVTQIKAIDDDTMKQAQAVRADTSLSQQDRRGKMMDIHKASEEKIRALLTDDQKTKYDALQAEMRAKMQERMQNREGGTPPTAPPQ
jgi:Spy/CpxP family protein refolding chaperone